MAILPGYDTSQYERKAPSGEPLPQGIYSGMVVRAEQKETKNRDGVYVEVEFDIVTPMEFRNRKFWDRFNVLNKSQKAQKIGEEGITDLAKAMGIQVLSDDQQLLHKEVQMEIVLKQSTDPNYPKPNNECRKYWPMGVNVEEAKRAAKASPSVAYQQPVAAPQQQVWGANSAPHPHQTSPAPTPQPQPNAPYNQGETAANARPAQPAPGWGAAAPQSAVAPQVNQGNAASGAFAPGSPWRRPA